MTLNKQTHVLHSSIGIGIIIFVSYVSKGKDFYRNVIWSSGGPAIRAAVVAITAIDELLFGKVYVTIAILLAVMPGSNVRGWECVTAATAF